jgi:hypothetical protein
MELVANWGVRPVFITSTFQDMQAERCWLWDFVFPAIEDRLRRRRRHLEWIDLRLGAGNAQAETEAEREAQVLKVCLDEVRRGRPFLIALIGDRYDWVPPGKRGSRTTSRAAASPSLRSTSASSATRTSAAAACSSYAMRCPTMRWAGTPPATPTPMPPTPTRALATASTGSTS